MKKRKKKYRTCRHFTVDGHVLISIGVHFHCLSKLTIVSLTGQQHVHEGAEGNTRSEAKNKGHPQTRTRYSASTALGCTQVSQSDLHLLMRKS